MIRNRILIEDRDVDWSYKQIQQSEKKKKNSQN